MDVRAADTSFTDLNKDLIRTNLGDGALEVS
jgi:hypothetical protein